MVHFRTLALAISFLLLCGQPAFSLKCGSGCAACWKDGSPGLDKKLSCDFGNHCGDLCPDGYSNLHCAKSFRCNCKDQGDCPDVGPCACGWKKEGTKKRCAIGQVNWQNGKRVCSVTEPK